MEGVFLGMVVVCCSSSSSAATRRGRKKQNNAHRFQVPSKVAIPPHQTRIVVDFPCSSKLYRYIDTELTPAAKSNVEQGAEAERRATADSLFQAAEKQKVKKLDSRPFFPFPFPC